MLDYETAWRFQGELVSARRSGVLNLNVLLLLEHHPVFTLGLRGGMENLKVSENFLQELGIPVIGVERGGDITFHGPGQLIGYGILDLRSAGLGLGEYVTGLEEIMIRSAGHWGIACERNPLNRGVWISNRKLGSIGVAVRRGVTFHGFAFNVNISLEPFTWINPCGLKGISATSLALELGREVDMCEVRDIVKRYVKSVFQVELITAGFEEVQSSIGKEKS